MWQRIVLFLCLLGWFYAVTPVHAASDLGWTIPSFSSDITVMGSGSVRVSETITVNFQTPKHGIYREIPVIYNQLGNNYYTSLKVLAVTRDHTPEPYTFSPPSTTEVIKIGNASQLLTGKHTYQLTYLVTGVLQAYSGYDELYWNVTGNKWEVPLGTAQATVHLPVALKRLTCFEGPYGATTPCLSTSAQNGAVFQATQSILPGEQLTIAVAYPHGMIPVPTVTPPPSFTTLLFSPISLGSFAMTVLLGIGGIFLVWWKRGRDLWWRLPIALQADQQAQPKPVFAHESIVVQFEPPQQLRPAEIGVLLDEQADTLDVTATIIDLAVRGYLTIEEVAKKWVFGSTDYIFQSTGKAPDQLLRYEQKLLTHLFGGKQSVTLSSLKNTFYDDLKKVKTALYTTVQEKKLFVENPESVRFGYIYGAMLLLITGVTGLFFSITQSASLFMGITCGVILIALFTLIAARLMPRRSAYGRELYRQAKGYELFVKTSEKYRQQFFEKHNLFQEVLPYAIVFHLTGKYAQAMKDMGIKPENPTWYTGTTPFQPVGFGKSMAAFTTSLSSAMTSTPSRSGTGGGGFSGGGFGGGGGGSW